MLLGKLNRKSVFIAFLLTYILVLLIPIFLYIMLYTKVETIMVDNADRYNAAMLEQIREIMDSRLNEIDGLAYQIVKNPKLNELLNHLNPPDDPDVYKFIEFMRDLERYKNASSFIIDFYVYFSQNDIILTPFTKTNTEMFYKLMYSYNGMDYEQWKNKILKGYYFKSYLPVMQISRGSDQRGVITYIQSLPYLETEDKGELVILIDEKQIKGLLDNIEGASQGTIFITDNHNRLIMATCDSSIPLQEISGQLANEKGLFDYRVNGQDMMVSYITLKQAGWKCISMVSKSMYMSKVDLLKKWAFWLMMVYLLAGIIVAYILANRNYKPVRKMITDIIKEKGIIPQNKSNEYGFIKETILDGLNEEKRLKNIISQQKLVVRANYLTRLIRGWVQSDGFNKDSFGFMDIDFISKYFLVMILNIDDYSRFVKEESEGGLASARLLIMNICSELINVKNQGFIVELDRDRLAALVCLNTGAMDNALEDINNIAVEINSVMKEKFGISVTIAIGLIHEGAEGIGESYRDALKAMDYRIVRGTSTVLHFDEDGYMENYYYYPVEVEIQLINFARTGEYKSIEKVLYNIFEINFSLNSITPYLSKCLFANLDSTIMKISNTLHVQYHDIFKDGFGVIDNFSTYKTAEDMQSRVKQLFKDVCEAVKSGRTGHSDQLLSKITEYVNQNCHDGTISLTSIADRFDITPQYLSTFFKKYSEKNLIDYIAEVRIKNAKKLLEDSNLTIAQIAQSVGYADAVGFIRVFKKNEGITPGKYRGNM